MLQRLALILWFIVFATVSGVQAASSDQQHGTYANITVDRSTPEKHLATFLSAVDRTVLRMKAREWARNFYDAWFYPPISDQEAGEIALLKKDVLDSMDLSGLPEWRRDSAGMETAFMLWEILKSEGMNKSTQFRQLRDGLWVIPGTYVQVGTIDSGMRMGDVVFTADMVANVPALYDAIIGDGNRTGFSPYRYVTETPGGISPPRWGGIAHKLPSFLRLEFGSNTVFQWLIALIAILLVLLVPWLAGKYVQDRGQRWFVQAVVMALLSINATRLLVNDSGLSGGGATAVTMLLMALHYGAIVTCILILGEWIGNRVSAVQEAADKTFDTSIIRLATRIISATTALGVVIYAISAAGVPVYGIIAGFGVGGLAVALAAKPTLENILAGVILFLDGSIKVGDTIDSSPLAGVIEDIGMRSTRIRAADGSLITVTNSELADKVIRNVSRRVSRPSSASPSQPPSMSTTQPAAEASPASV